MNKYYLFVLGGKALFSITYTHPINKATTKYTYYVRMDGRIPKVYTYYDGKWKYIGKLYSTSKYKKYWQQGDFSNLGKHMEIFRWFWSRVIRNMDMPEVRISHNGRCSRCGRRLTDESSKERGLGPVCLKKVMSKLK